MGMFSNIRNTVRGRVKSIGRSSGVGGLIKAIPGTKDQARQLGGLVSGAGLAGMAENSGMGSVLGGGLAGGGMGVGMVGRTGGMLGMFGGGMMGGQLAELLRGRNYGRMQQPIPQQPQTQLPPIGRQWQPQFNMPPQYSGGQIQPFQGGINSQFGGGQSSNAWMQPRPPQDQLASSPGQLDSPGGGMGMEQLIAQLQQRQAMQQNQMRQGGAGGMFRFRQ